MISSNVAGNLCNKSSATGLVVCHEFPKSPLNTFEIYIMNCSKSDLSSPNSALKFSKTEGVANGPAINTAGSPGISCRNKKLTSVIPKSCGITKSKRFPRNK